MSLIINHETAEKTSAVERYLLGESTLEERVAFEAHFFDCEVCGAQVRAGSVFVDNYRAAMQEDEERASFPERAPHRARWNWLQWLRPATLVPSFAAMALGLIVGYQNLVTIPAMLQPQVLSDLTIAPQARGKEDIMAINRRRPIFNLNFDVNSPRFYSEYQCIFKNRSGEQVFAIGSGPQTGQSFQLDVLLQSAKFSDGSYTMTLRPSSDKSITIDTYSFTIKTGEPK